MPLEIVRNDITKMDTDAIVNAANTALTPGGGVCGAIHAAAGPELWEECRALHGCNTGDAKITKGYHLTARYVIHTAGPVWQDGHHHEEELLRSCYTRSLALAKEYHCESIAFPLISSGIYGYPMPQAMQVAIDAITNFLFENELTVYLVVFSKKSFDVSHKVFQDVKAYIDDTYVDTHQDRAQERRRRAVQAKMMALPSDAAFSSALPDFDDMMKQLDESFSQMLLRKIDEQGIKDSECYHHANVDRRLFNKIKNNPHYKPGKQTVLAFAVSLRLSLAETQELLSKAGFSLSHSSLFDVVMEYFISKGIYDLWTINTYLFDYDLPQLGS